MLAGRGCRGEPQSQHFLTPKIPSLLKKTALPMEKQERKEVKTEHAGHRECCVKERRGPGHEHGQKRTVHTHTHTHTQ